MYVWEKCFLVQPIMYTRQIHWGGGGNQKIFANLDVLQLLNSNQYNSGDQPYSDHSPYSGYSL